MYRQKQIHRSGGSGLSMDRKRVFRWELKKLARNIESDMAEAGGKFTGWKADRGLHGLCRQKQVLRRMRPPFQWEESGLKNRPWDLLFYTSSEKLSK
ncbi:hypothetical protein [Candidatus Soleaferrea massiliensis]|uniref:hypothetical protein n=1 Tax=Candidatus Soleaferrea massiliensis TaxID=1470354 RepID=UPI0012E0B324|nr:hypothetical protein [Candidatus Soleaferrea massiliensis]